MQNETYNVIGTYGGTNNNMLEYGQRVLVKPTGQDVLVKIKAISVNPIDTKLRQALPKQNTLKVFGYDAVGEIIEMGPAVVGFEIGDNIFYAGTIRRDGSNGEYQLINAKLVAKKPNTLTLAQSVAMPLTSLTAYELLFEKLGLIPRANAHKGQTLLIINGAGGVGAIATQLGKWIGMTVISTAGNETSRDFCFAMGADFVVNHYQNYQRKVTELGFNNVDYVIVLNALEQHFRSAAALIAPFGHIGSIIATPKDLPLTLLKNKSASFDWEYMFAKTDYNYQIDSQGKYLNTIAKLLDEKILKTTVKIELKGINLHNLNKAHAMIENGHIIGKIVLVGKFE